MNIIANLTAKQKAVIRRDFLIDNFKGAYGNNATATLLLDFARCLRAKSRNRVAVALLPHAHLKLAIKEYLRTTPFVLSVSFVMMCLFYSSARCCGLCYSALRVLPIGACG